MKKILYMVLIINVFSILGCGAKTSTSTDDHNATTIATTEVMTSTATEEFKESDEHNIETKIKNDIIKDETSENVKATEAKEIKNSDKEEACLKEAQEYIDDISGYSPKVLKMTLEYDGYTESEIDYAMDNIKVDWSIQAKKYCKDLLNLEYTRQEAYSELVGWGFTSEEAKAAMAAVYY